MGDASWGYGRPAERDTGVLQVLQAFATQGGQLYGARRWAENPLTLTHVRWLGPANVVLDGFRPPDDDQAPPEEREVWIQLALLFPSAHPSPAGPEAPWLPLNVTPTQAGAWAQALSQAQSARRFASQAASAPPYPSYPQSMPQSYPQPYQQPNAGQSPWRLPASAAPAQSGAWGGEQRISGAPADPGMRRGDPTAMPASGGVVPGATVDAHAPRPVISAPPAPARSASRNIPGWDRAQPESLEIALLPSIEIELPPLMPAGGPAGRREFARDAALVFARALRPLPQVRELRGWLRGERLVLAARYIAGIGGRAATYAEMESTTQHVADALARHTLPYAWLGFAEPGEWSQGAALPE